MAFADKFTKLSGGIWKHKETGFVVHEVFSLDQVMACNGMLTYFDDDDTWTMFAGRTLGALIAASAASNMVGLAAASSFSVKAMVAPLQIILDGNADKCTGRPVIATASMPFTLKPRMFGLVTNAMDGFKPRKVSTDMSISDSAPTKPAVVCFPSAAAQGTPVDIGLSTSFGTLTTNGPFSSCSQQGALTDPIAHLVVRLPTGVSVADYWRQVENNMEYKDKSEVKAYLAESKIRFDRLAAVTPHSTDLYVSVAGVAGQLNVVNADRKIGTHTSSMLGDAMYNWMRYNGTWLRVPSLISASKMVGCWMGAAASIDDTKILTRYSLSPVGGIGGRSAMSLFGGIAGDANAAAPMSLNSLLGMNVSGMENFGVDLGVSPQNVGESQAAYETRVLANKPKWIGLGGWKFHPYPSVEHMGGAGALSIIAALALSEDTYIGEYVQAFMHHRAPNRSAVSMFDSAANVTAAGGKDVWIDSVMGLKLFDGTNLEVAAGNIFGA